MQALLDMWRMRRYPYLVPPRILSLVDRGSLAQAISVLHLRNLFPTGQWHPPAGALTAYDALSLTGGWRRLNDAIRYSKRPVSDDQP